MRPHRRGHPGLQRPQWNAHCDKAEEASSVIALHDSGHVDGGSWPPVLSESGSEPRRDRRRARGRFAPWDRRQHAIAIVWRCDRATLAPPSTPTSP